MTDYLSAHLFDALILIWLVVTWFYEGHHRRCVVEIGCRECGTQVPHNCVADRRNK